jgi:hypothetical protein
MLMMAGIGLRGALSASAASHLVEQEAGERLVRSEPMLEPRREKVSSWPGPESADLRLLCRVLVSDGVMVPIREPGRNG